MAKKPNDPRTDRGAEVAGFPSASRQPAVATGQSMTSVALDALAAIAPTGDVKDAVTGVADAARTLDTATELKAKQGKQRQNRVGEGAESDPDHLTDSDAVLGLTRLYDVDSKGFVLPVSARFDLEPMHGSLAHSVDPASEAGSLPIKLALNASRSRMMILQPGAGVVLGKPDTGKSLFANSLRKHNPDRVKILRFREPEPDSMHSEMQLVRTLYHALYMPEYAGVDVIFVDSLRTTFYSSTGTTGKGGVNMAIFALLTTYDLVARSAGKVILFALNPMSTDDSSIDYYLEASRGSVSHTMHATSPMNLRLSSRSAATRDYADLRYEAPSRQATPDGVYVSEHFVGPKPSIHVRDEELWSTTLVDLFIR